MHSEFTMIPVVRKDSLLEDLKDLEAEVDDFWQQQNAFKSIIFRLDVWTDWDAETRKIVGEAEEEQRQVSTSEVSDISAASV